MASFEELQALAEVVSKNKVKHIHVIGNPDSKATKFEQFYDALASGRFQNDTEAAAFFYQASPDHAAYRKLKERLQERMENSLIFLDLNQSIFNNYNKAYFSSYKKLAVIKNLIARGDRTAAIPIAEKVLEIALEYGLTDIALLMAKELRTHYGAMRGIKGKYEKMDTILANQIKILTAEFEAEKFLSKITTDFFNSKAIKPEYIQKVQAHVEELEKLALEVKSYRFNYLYFLVKASRYELAGDYVKLLCVSQEALSFFLGKKQFVANNVLYSFYIRKLLCLIQLKKYQDAREIIPRCLDHTPSGVFNWFIILNYHIILSYHSGNFQQALEIAQTALQHPKLKSQDERTREFWHIHEIYLYYFILKKKIIPNDNNSLKKFRLSKFLNEVPICSKDKRGANISILILQILFLLHEKKYNAIIDRAESLKTYTYRYLRRDDTFRSHCFIRMLLTLPECSFNKTTVLRRADKYWQQLQAMPLNVARQSAEIEIVPYETLWAFVLEELDGK